MSNPVDQSLDSQANEQANAQASATADAPESGAESISSQLHQLPDSPCIGICSTLFDEVCQGCGRTAGEVSNWVFLSDEEKLAVWRRITAEGTSVRFVRGVKG